MEHGRNTDMSATGELFRRLGAWLVLLSMLLAVRAQAWGPHPAITQAALDALGTNDALVVALGTHAQRLTNTCWMADFKRLPFRDADQDFYADDYLLFPQVTAHLDHICPEVKKSYRPYFQRALQALRMESRANAARWIGALLHFVEDTGSPPHAAEIRGGVHSNMENWVDASAIRIAGYKPRLLGHSEAEVLGGLHKRMDELIEFSKPRGRRLTTQVIIGNQRAVRPVVLECALETSRVVADVLHALGQLALQPLPDSAVLQGTIVSETAPGFERCPARVVVLGTNFATLAGVDGRFELRSMPAGEWVLSVLRPGCLPTNVSVRLHAARTNAIRIQLSEQPASLVRNADFQLKWIRLDAPDAWTRTGTGWEGEVIPLVNGRRYELSVRFKTNAPGDVLLRWTRAVPYGLPHTTKMPKVDSAPLTPEHSSLSFTGSVSMALLQVTVRTRRAVEDVCERIDLLPMQEIR